MLPPAAHPPASAPAAGIATIRITTNRGEIEIQADRSRAGCAVAGITHLAASGYYAAVACHRLFTEGIYFVQCGDPSGTGIGGFGYEYAMRSATPSPAPTSSKCEAGLPTGIPTDLPTELFTGTFQTSFRTFVIIPGQAIPSELLPSGWVQGPTQEWPDWLLPCGAHRTEEHHFTRGAVVPAVDGRGRWSGQFFLVYRDSDIVSDGPELGRVTKGLEILDAVAAGGADTHQKPRTPLVIQAVVVS